MRFTVERQHVSPMGEVRWMKVAGPFESRAEAEIVVIRAADAGGRALRITQIGIVRG